ncbi:tripartite tricarboxylate transporter substrate binding protein [Bordetella petrii]|nr:tripartite tricarboxylate transporter substrate binding protein [Bordetella petrii]
MFKKLLGLTLASLTLAAGNAAAAQSGAQGYPDKPVRIIVASGTASSPDSISRIVAEKLSAKWGQPVVIENAAGLGGIIGTERASRANPDGYTLLVSTIGAMAVGVSIMDNLPYDPVKDFEPVTMIMSMPNLFVVHPSVPVKNLGELITYIKQNPGKLRYGHPGIGTTPHLSAELLKQLTNIQMDGIPYKASSQMTTDFLAGQYEVLFHNASVLLPYVQSGKATLMGITSPKRVPSLPDVPTVAEAGGGLKNFAVHAWWGLHAPAGTPDAIVQKVSADVSEILAQPDVTKWIEERGGQVGGGTPDELRQYQADETAKWRDLIKKANIKAD